MTRENQAVHADLAGALEARNELEQNLRDYVDKAMYIEHMLKQKEDEKEQLLNSYRSLSSEASTLESVASQASQAHAEAKMELQSKDHVNYEMQASPPLATRHAPRATVTQPPSVQCRLVAGGSAIR